MKPHDQLCRILSELVAFRTVSGYYDAAMGCVGYAEAYLESRGMKVERHESGGFPSLVATTRATRTPKVLLQAHIDVVAAPDKCFKLLEKDGRLYGRGVFDMKFAMAVFLRLVDELQNDLSDYDFGIMLTSDEELGGEDGVKCLLEQGYGAEVCLLPDAGTDWKLETGHKGCWIAKVSAKGEAAHGSRPWEGDNAIDRLMDALRAFRLLFDGQHEDSDTLSINRIVGGAVANQVADSAEAVMDMRFVDEASYGRLHEQFQSIAERHRVSLETVRLVKTSATDTAHPLVQPFLRITERLHGRTPETVRSLGVSDAHFFGEHGIPVILSRPKGGAAHGDGEWIDKEDLLKYYQAVKAYVREVAAT